MCLQPFSTLRPNKQETQMNTLSKKITPIFFKEENKTSCYNEVRELWLTLQKNDEIQLTLAHHILYAILRGKDWRKCFTPITNEVKLANGAAPDYAFTQAFYRLNSRLDVFNDFASLIEPEQCAKLVRSLLQGRKASAYNPAPLEELSLKNQMSVEA